MSQIGDVNAGNVTITSDVIETIIGAKTRFKGTVTTDKPIRIDGIYEGDIESTGIVIVSSTGKFNGNIKCKDLHLSGEGEGTVFCSELMRFEGNAHFKGEATTRDIVISEGAIFDGNLTMTKR